MGGGRRPKFQGFLSPSEARTELEKLRPLRHAVTSMMAGRFHVATPGHDELYDIVKAIDRAAERFCGDREYFLPPL